MPRIHVTPKPGIKVRDQITREFLPADGDWQDDSTDWRRREADGDVVISTSPPDPAPTIAPARAEPTPPPPSSPEF